VVDLWSFCVQHIFLLGSTVRGALEIHRINTVQYVNYGSMHLIFIFLLISDISIVPLQVHYYSEALPTTALILCRS